MIRNRLKTLIVAVAAVLASVVSAEALTLTGGEQFYWNGHESTIIEPFQTEGRWKLTLGASCFEGVGFVSVDIFDANDELVEQVIVLGEGISSAVIEPPAGEYYLSVHVSNHHVYTWEIVVEPTEEDLTEARVGAHAAHAQAGGETDAAASDTATATQADALLSTVSHTSSVELPYALAGNRNLTTDSFEVSGEWKLSLAAWCHEGVSHVRVTAFNHEGVEVGNVTVFGEGEQTGTFNTDPGTYYLVVHTPNPDAYSWELLVEDLAADATAQGSTEAEGDATTAASTQVVADGPLSGVVEIQMTQDSTSAYFNPVGVWVEPGTTIRFVLGEGVHDSRSYHPSSGIELSRIPEGAEPWDSGI